MRLIKPRLSTKEWRTVPLPPKQRAPIYATSHHVAWSRAVRERAGFRCEQCGRSGVRLFADHIKEIKDGGALFDLNNGQCVCGSCHTAKTNEQRRLR